MLANETKVRDKITTICIVFNVDPRGLFKILMKFVTKSQIYSTGSYNDLAPKDNILLCIQRPILGTYMCVHQVKSQKSKSFYYHNYMNIVHTFERLKPCWVYLSRISTHTW